MLEPGACPALPSTGGGFVQAARPVDADPVTVSDHFEVIRGQVRRTGYRRVSHGVYVPVIEPRHAALVTRQNLAAWQTLLPPDGVFTHITGAALRGWWLPRLPEFAPVFVAMPEDSPRPRRAGIVCSRLRRETRHQLIQGLPVESAEEILLRAARDLALFDLTILVTSAMRSPDFDRQGLARVSGTSRPGVRALRAAARWADARAESPFEILLAFFHELAGIAVEPQVEVFDDDGHLLGRADLRVVGTTDLHEYDGEWHSRSGQLTIDRRRDRRFAGSRYTRRGFVAADLFVNPLTTLQELDRVVGRGHDPARIESWRRHLAESTFSVAGRRRLQNRWLRLTGANDWSRTA
jgi:hypothetical protein